MKTESLIFDIDGTLWDSRALVADGYNLQLRDEGLDQYCVNAEQLKALFGKTMSEIADIMLADIEVPERYALMERCMEREDAYLRENALETIAYDGVKETLEVLSKKYRLFIVSNSQKGYPEITMQKIGVEHLFTGHLCFGDTQTEKGETIKTLMKMYDIKDAVYIGDTQGDYESTLVAGISFIWACYGFGEPSGYAAKIDAIKELMDLF
jgi:phosphoglycolate phosphatase